MQQWAAFSTVAHLFLAAVPFKLCNDASQFVGEHKPSRSRRACTAEPMRLSVPDFRPDGLCRTFTHARSRYPRR